MRNPLNDSRMMAALDVPEDRRIALVSLATVASLSMIEVFGTVAAACFVPCLAMLVLLCRNQGAVTRADIFCLAVPSFALLTALWSRDPSSTIRAAAELFLSPIAAIMLARVITPRYLLTCFATALIATLPLHFLFGNGGEIMTGLFESKNFFAIRMILTLFVGLYVFFSRNLPIVLRLVGLLTVVMSAFGLVQARSAGAIVASMPALMAMVTLALLMRVSNRSRAVVLTAIAVFGTLGIILFVVYFNAIFEFLLAASQKDAGLTGRDYLWMRALGYIGEYPWGGQGYQAFWQVGNIEAEGLWRVNHVHSGAGFHFHNLYLNTTVEMGLIGLLISQVFLVCTYVTVARWALTKPSTESAFFAAFVAVTIVRSFVELDFPIQFMTTTFLLFCTWTFATRMVARAPVPRAAEMSQASVIRGRAILNG